MKNSKNIIYIILLIVIIYLIYKAYTNYQISGSIFSSTPVDLLGAENSTSRFGYPISNKSIVSGYISGRDCLKMCPSCTWTTNGGCYPPVVKTTPRN